MWIQKHHHDSRHAWRRLLTALGLTGLALFLAAPKCGGGGDPPVDAAPLLWYRTCGDPVCSGYTPTPGDVVCTDQAAGDPCAQVDGRCEIPDDDCNADLMCTDRDPATNCPISLASAKRDIHYLTHAERAAIAEALKSTKLATYRYRADRTPTPLRLGFLIDDQPASPAVLPSGERVDLYGYTSMAVAAIQTQAEEIDRLNARIQALEARLHALEHTPAGPLAR